MDAQQMFGLLTLIGRQEQTITRLTAERDHAIASARQLAEQQAGEPPVTVTPVTD